MIVNKRERPPQDSDKYCPNKLLSITTGFNVWDRSQTEEWFLRNEEALLIHLCYVLQLSLLHSHIFVRSALFRMKGYGETSPLHHSSVRVCTDIKYICLLHFQEQEFGWISFYSFFSTQYNINCNFILFV